MMSINNSSNTINNTAKKISFCANCGVEFEKSGNAQKYCVDCKPVMAAAMRKEWTLRNSINNTRNTNTSADSTMSDYKKAENWKKIRTCRICKNEYMQEIKYSHVCPVCRMDIVGRPTQRQKLAERKERLIKNMLQLREQGYTNTDIGKEYKMTMKLVYYYIGKEPREYWLSALRLGQSMRKKKNEANKKARHDRKKIMCQIKFDEQKGVCDKALLDLDQKRKEYDEQQKKAFEAQQKLNELKKALEAC